MEIEHSIKKNILIITLKSERLDAKDSPHCKEDILNLINETGIYQAVFDLNHLYFIDSSGISVFLSILRYLNSKGGDLKLSAITQPVRTILVLISMDKIFEIFNDPEEAVNSFDSSLTSPKE